MPNAGVPDRLTQEFVKAVGPSSTGFALGNAVSVNVVERLVGRVLFAARLVDASVLDMWSALPASLHSSSSGQARLGPCIEQRLYA